jgi:thioredoxin reductase (NADPH)
MGRGVSGCATCDGFSIAAGSLRGGRQHAVEERSTCRTSLPRSTSFTAATSSVPKHPHRQADGQGGHRKGAALWKTLDEVLGDASGVTGVRLRSTQGDEVEKIALTGCFIAIGHQPNTDIFRGHLEMKTAT